VINQNKLKKLISNDRLKGYTTPFAQLRHKDPIILYKWNCALSESFYPLLQTIEVSFRNSVHQSIVQKFGDENWLWKNALLLAKEKLIVNKVINVFEKKQKSYCVGDLIAELKFGFWTALLDKRYEQKLWPKIIKLTLPGMDNKQRRIDNIRTRFHVIRKFRNRIMHYEPVWHWQNLQQIHDDILEAIEWIEPDLLQLVDIDRFSAIYTSGPR